MRPRIIHITLLALLSAACDKNLEGPTSLLGPEIIKSYDDEDVLVLTDATAGDGVVLLTFIDNGNNIYFKLIRNNGDELWTVDPGLTFLQNSRAQYVQKVLFENDDLITVFYLNARIRYSLNGEEVSREEDFIQVPWSNMDINNIAIGADGNYLVIGNASVSGMRAAYFMLDREGNMLSPFLFAITPNGGNAYTGVVVMEDGSYMLAGAYTSPLQQLSNAYFVTKVAATGEALWTVSQPTTPFHGATFDKPGRDLIRTSDGHFLYVIDGWGDHSGQRIVRFTQFGEDLGDQRDMAFADFNISYATPPFIGTVVAEHSDGSIYGVMNSRNWSLLNGLGLLTASYFPPHYAYFYQYTPRDHSLDAAYFDRTYSNYLSAATRLSNGKVMLAGTILSLGVDKKIIITIK